LKLIELKYKLLIPKKGAKTKKFESFEKLETQISFEISLFLIYFLGNGEAFIPPSILYQHALYKGRRRELTIKTSKCTAVYVHTQ
jgi:hypothetical protein